MSAAELLTLCKDLGWTVATAESCTGGMVAAALTDPAGASAVMQEGVVTYSNTAKIRHLGVRQGTLDAHGAVSEAVAAEMADGCRTRAQVDLAVSITGIAGPGGSDHKPEGRVCFGLATRNGVVTETVDFGAPGRHLVRQAARDHALALLTAAARAAQAQG